MNLALLPWPNRMLSPNARVHHMLKSRYIRASRFAAAALVRKFPFHTIRNPVCAVIPIVTTKRRRDIDNVLAGLKSALDGVTDAGWWHDDCEIMAITIRKPVYIKSWTRDPIILVADEACNEDRMMARIRSFAEWSVEDAEGAFLELTNALHRNQIVD